ncbi:MAG: amidase [Alphaproteobacteria bacterium]|jgi:aspartyl-tRNA(Asn)/glutamyl-tRNA(Gln) amidotransferase subunit A
MTGMVGDPGSVRALAGQVRDGALTARALVEHCLARIDAVDDVVRAWISVDAEGALAEADACDTETGQGRLRGPLHGVPFAIKDVIDVAGWPTRAGSRSRDDAPPARIDATVVARLRAQGAIPLGKVHTTEFAYFDGVPPTRNPYDLTRTPGGSSGGPGAAIASGTVPFALGTQTAGSVSRPAAYCGIGAFKPSTLSVVGAGVTPFAPSYDTVGVFAATAADAAFVMQAMAPEGLGLAGVVSAGAPAEAVFLDDPLIADKADVSVTAAMAALRADFASAGVAVREAAAPVPLGEVLALHRTVILYEVSRVHAGLLDVADRVGPRLIADIRHGLKIEDSAYREALAALIAARRAFWGALPWPALTVVPAAPGPAPIGEATGDPSFISPLTALGGPIASVPAGTCPQTNMPLGAMLCVPPGCDAELVAALSGATEGPLTR